MITKKSLLFISGLGIAGAAVIGLDADWQVLFGEAETGVRKEGGTSEVNTHSSPDTALLPNDKAAADAKRKLDQLSSELRNEMAAVRSRMEVLDRQQRLLENGSQRADAPSPDDPTLGEEDKVTAADPEEEFARAEAETQAQLNLMQETVVTEEVDEEWASASALALEETLQREELKGLHLVRADCRKTLCQLELSFREGAEESMRKLPFFTPWASEVFFHSDGKTGEGFVFIAREGHRLPGAPDS